ncbi:hypothetical protein [Anaerotignum sp.]
MAKFPVPSSPARGVIKVETFKGVDLNSSPSNVENYRSPNAPNMMRDVPGKVRKRQGYEKIKEYAGKRINGVHILRDVENGIEKELTHAGTSLYLDGEVIYEGMADERSVGRQFYGKLFIFDGKKALCYGEFETEAETADETETEGEEKPKAFMVKALEDAAYIPTVIISRNPTGGGTTLEPLNLIGRKWKESFLSDGTATTYQLTTKELDEDKVTVRIMTKEGEWEDKTEDTDFTVDRKAGTVTFKTAPVKSPVTGYDNVEITAAKTREGYADKINKCKIISLFGVNGAMDRMFVSGNPEFPNQDWYCNIADGFFWGDLWYSTLGQDGSAVVGYTIINDRLAVHKSDAEEGRNVILRKGEIEGDEAVFPIIGTLSGRGALGSHAFGYLGSEPLFLTDIGIMAITAADLTGEKYSQSRSYYIDNVLTAEKNLGDAFAYVWRDFYLISTGTGRVYLLDGLQKSYDKNSPYSNFQYECYYWENVPARVFWEDGEGRLCFGDAEGNVFRFYDDVTSQKSYNDNGEAIFARWDTPELSGKLFYKNKTFRRVDFVLAPAIATGATVFAQVKGVWSEIFDSGASAMYFDFTHINWERINFSTDDTPRTMGGKIRIKKVDKVAFSLRNERINEPFGIYSLAFEYTESGNYKG